MRGQYIAGLFLLLNEKATIRRLKKYCMYPGPMPIRYPCLLDSRIGADEDSYAHYVYLIDVENMRNALLKAEESVPTVKQQGRGITGMKRCLNFKKCRKLTVPNVRNGLCWQCDMKREREEARQNAKVETAYFAQQAQTKITPADVELAKSRMA